MGLPAIRSVPLADLANVTAFPHMCWLANHFRNIQPSLRPLDQMKSSRNKTKKKNPRPKPKSKKKKIEIPEISGYLLSGFPRGSFYVSFFDPDLSFPPNIPLSHRGNQRLLQFLGIAGTILARSADDTCLCIADFEEKSNFFISGLCH